MNINQVAKQTGLTAKAIRLYEEKGLIFVPSRQANGYRLYNEQHIADLTLIRQAREIGFSLPECSHLLNLARNPKRRSADVKKQTLTKIAELEQQIEKLYAMKQRLEKLSLQCPDNEEHHCPIIDCLSGKQTCCNKDQ